MKAGEKKEFMVVFDKDAPKKELAGRKMQFKVKLVSVQKMELPEINDEFAKQLGAFDSLVALKKNMKEGMAAEKKEAEKQRRRGEILEKIAEKTKVEIPEVMVNYEKENLLEDLKNRVVQGMKISFEEYLTTTKQTEAQLKETFQKEAEKRLRGYLVLRELGKVEKVEVLDKEVDDELKKATQNYSKEQLSQIDINQFREYTKGVLYNEKTFQKLENFSA